MSSSYGSLRMLLALAPVATLALAFNTSAVSTVTTPSLSGSVTTRSTTSRDNFCRTVLTDGPVVSVQTLTYQAKIPLTYTATSTLAPTVTVTPPVCNDTTTLISTVTAVVTACSGTSSVVNATTTVTRTALSTTLVTQTVSAPFIAASVTASIAASVTVTNTISTTSGFLPVVDTTATAFPNLKRDVEDSADLSARRVPGSIAPVGQVLAPSEVICTEVDIIKILVINRANATITSTLPAVTHVATATSTETVTSSVYPANITGLATVTTTTTGTTTQTTTKTLTTNVAAPTATALFYAQCAQSNLLGPTLSSGANIFNAYYNETTTVGTLTLSNTTAADPYSCCVACTTTTNCASSFYNVNSNVCYLLTGLTCASGQSSNSAFYVDSSNETAEYVVSNGGCGWLFDGGNNVPL